MRVIEIDAEQGHAVPDRILEARGPFGRVEPEVVDLPPDPNQLPPGATAQNNYREVALYECQACGGVVREDDLDIHECKER